MRFIRFILIVFIGLGCASQAFARQDVTLLSKDMFDAQERLFLAELDGWQFKKGHDASWANVNLNTNDWKAFKPLQLSAALEDENGRIEGWFRIKFQLDDEVPFKQFYLSRDLWLASDIYIDGIRIHSFGNGGLNKEDFDAFNPSGKLPVPLNLLAGKEYVLAIHVVHYEHVFTLRELRLNPVNLKKFLILSGPSYHEMVYNKSKSTVAYAYATIAISTLLMLLFWLLVLRNPSEKILLYIALLSSLIFIYGIVHYFDYLVESSYQTRIFIGLIWSMTGPLFAILDLMIMERIIKKKIRYLAILILILYPISSAYAHLYDRSLFFTIVNTVMLSYFGYLVFLSIKTSLTELRAIIIGIIVNITGLMTWVGLHKYYYDLFLKLDNPIILISILSIPISLMAYVSIRLNNSIKEVNEKAKRLIELSEEKKEILANQNMRLEKEVQERTNDLNQSLENLKTTQNQLIHSEKMASLGELTAGIAHEIQNPLNFVNNFSDLNKELIEELKEAVAQNNQEEVSAILTDLSENERKINHHGKRAEEIVKSMLQHSRTSSGEKELTDINALADEYLRLAYHGLRAKDKSFNADFKTDLDPELPKLNVVPQDIGRVLLNLINNAFQAVKGEDKPEVVVFTKHFKDSIQITVSDNGPGIPENIRDKIFQPFFTTKAAGEGTGLGLSMSYDIITKGHGGTIEVESESATGTTFTITLAK